MFKKGLRIILGLVGIPVVHASVGGCAGYVLGVFYSLLYTGLASICELNYDPVAAVLVAAMAAVITGIVVGVGLLRHYCRSADGRIVTADLLCLSCIFSVSPLFSFPAIWLFRRNESDFVYRNRAISWASNIFAELPGVDTVKGARLWYVWYLLSVPVAAKVLVGLVK